ncbi:MAG: CBS domain-containing protein [Gemmatimonadaceae bacterium]
MQLARDIMTDDLALITADDTVPSAAALMRTRGVGMLPVVDDLQARHFVGAITDRDIVVRHVAVGHGPTARVHEHMSREPLVTVAPTSTVDEVADAMMRFQVRRVPVVDGGKVVGIIAQADLALKVGPEDPGLVEGVTEAISRPGTLVSH